MEIALAQTATGTEVHAESVTAEGVELENDSVDTVYLRWVSSGTTVSENAYNLSLSPGEKIVLRRAFARQRLIAVWATPGTGTLRGLRA